MQIDRNELASVTYWRSSQETRSQRFYVAFCLLTSSIQDLMLGLKERDDHNLNWSATCSYYSLVHAGRLLTFLALGDFPTSHSSLRRLLAEERHDGHSRPLPDDGYPFDWLRGFTRVAQPNQAQGRPPAGVARDGPFRPIILGYLEQIGVQDPDGKLARFGRILAAAGPLRNDSNYEALLIAHEHRHVAMTSAFDHLAENMARAADSSISLAIEVFNRYFRGDPDLPPDRREYESFLHDYLHERVLEAVRRKLRGSTDLERKLADVVAMIDARPTRAPYDHLEDQISMGIFGNKARLMRDFDSRIEFLAGVVGTCG